jgi:hypothetical protein
MVAEMGQYVHAIGTETNNTMAPRMLGICEMDAMWVLLALRTGYSHPKFLTKLQLFYEYSVILSEVYYWVKSS